MTPRARAPAHEGSSAVAPGGRVAKLSIATPLPYYGRVHSGAETGGIVYTEARR